MPDVKRQIRLLALLNFFTDLRFYAPVAVLFYAAIAGSWAAGMLYMSIASVTTVLMELPAGVYSDRRGRVPTLRLGALLHLLSPSAMLAAAMLMVSSPRSSLILLYVAAVFEGAGRAFYSGNNDALVHDLTAGPGKVDDSPDFAGTMGRLQSMFQFALALAALAGGFLAGRGWAFVLAPTVVSLAAAFAVSLCLKVPDGPDPRVIPDQEPPGRGELGNPGPGEQGSAISHLTVSIREFFTNRRILANGSAEMIGQAVGEASYQFRVAFISSLWPVAWLGASRMADNLTAAFGFLFAGRLIRRYGEYPLLIAGKIYGRVANLAGLLFPTPVSPIIMSSAGVFYGSTTVSRQSLMHKLYSDRQRATLASVGSLFGALLLAGFAPLLGLAADVLGVIPALLACQILMLLPLGIDIILYRRDSGN